MPTNFGTGFGPSFGFSGWNNQQFGSTNQLTAPTKQQKFPGLTDEQIKRLESITSDPQRQQELYQQTIQQLNSQNVKDNRFATENEMAYKNLNQKDIRQKNYTDSQIRLEQLADLTKDKFGLRQDANTQDVVNGLIQMAQDEGVSLDEMNNYLDTGDQNFLYNMGLKENPKEKLKENFWDSVWDNIRTKANVPVDTVKKRGKRTLNEASEKIYKGMLKNFVGDSIIGEMGINLDDYVDTLTDKTVAPALKQETLDYQNQINERYKALEEKNLDQDIKNYYDNKGYTKLLKEGDFKGFLYKSMGDAAQNREMPVVIAASVAQPEIGLALMTTDAYARENEEAFENMMNNGASYEQAQQGAVAVGLVNAAVEVTLEKLLGGVETTTADAIRRTLMKNVQEEATKKGLGKILLEGVGTQLRSSTEEGLEEIVQQIVQNAAVKTVNENQELFEGVGEAFEGGFYNPLNLLAGGGNINQNIQNNKSQIRQSIMDTATTATTQSRDLLDAISDKTQSTVDNTKNKVSGLVDQTYGIDETLKKGIQNNPYAAQVWAKTKEYIEENGRPEKSNEVPKSLISDVADRVQEKLMEKMKEGGESGKLYKPLLEAGYSVDLSELNNQIDEILERDYGIKVEDGKLDFSKTAIDGSEANNIRKIYNWIKDTNKPMSLEEYKNRFRQSISDMVEFNNVGRDQAGRKKADTQGDKVLKGIRTFANNLAHAQIPELAALDKQFNEWVEVMDEVSDGLVYKDSSKRGVIRDNIAQIISNLDTKNRRQLANRLEKLMPGITEEVHAINMMPQLIDHVYKPTKLQKGITSGAGGVVGAAVGSLVGQPVIGSAVGAGIGYWLSGKIDQLKSSKWDKIISETSEDGKAKLNDIQARIKKNEKISQEQKAFLEKMSKKLKEGKADKEAEVAKIIAEVSSAEDGDVVSVLNDAIERLDTIGAKEEVKVVKQWMNDVQDALNEKAELDKAEADFEEEKQQIIDQESDQKLPYFKKKIYQLEQQEKRVGTVAGKKIGKTFEGKDFKKKQDLEWLKAKDKLIEEIGEWYNVDQFEAAEIYDRIERTVSMDDLGFNGKPASSKTAYQRYGAANPNERGISATEGLNIRNFKNGKTVKELANQYGIDTKIVDSISTPEGQRAYGMYGDRLITLSKDLVESTVPHELLHGVFDIVDSKRRTSILEGIQKKLNIDNVQAEEWLADNFSEYYRTGKFGTQGLAKTFVEKIKQFFYQIKSYIDGTYANEKQIRQLFNDIIGGKIEGEYGVYSDPKFQSVWHGSPYSFEKFDSAHMGEGEGAQAHGWGHYVAKDKETGYSYSKLQDKKTQYRGEGYRNPSDRNGYGVSDKDMLIDEFLRELDRGEKYEDVKGYYIEQEKDIINDCNRWLKEAKKEGVSELEGFTMEEIQTKKKLAQEKIDLINSIKKEDFIEVGQNLYEVEIPDPVKRNTPTGSNYLEEDGKITKTQLNKIADALEDYTPEKVIDKGEDLPRLSKDAEKKMADRAKESALYRLRNAELDGAETYRALVDILGSDKAASKFLESLGYDGIHYFGGRDGEAYVIFNDDALQITKHHKY